MFAVEATFRTARRRKGRRKAIELVADINRYAGLRSPTEPGRHRIRPNLKGQRCVLDLNEHFLELSNMGEEDRAMMLWVNGLVAVATLAFLLAMAWAIARTAWMSSEWIFLVTLGAGIAPAPLAFYAIGWSTWVAPGCFTALKARYRFNRSTGLVYVLRPARFGGNAILDWRRVQAHVRWCAPRGMRHSELRDPVAREARQTVRRSLRHVRGLVLYWPPLDPKDGSRLGEDVLWVGPTGAGKGLWDYICMFMQEGLDAVPQPTPAEWLRKGLQTPAQFVRESAAASGREPGSAPPVTCAATVHCLAEKLCTWPEFPVEWNSDCGRRRRESGIGPEEPTRWAPS